MNFSLIHALRREVFPIGAAPRSTPAFIRSARFGAATIRESLSPKEARLC